MPLEIDTVPGRKDRLRAALSVGLRAFVAENRGTLSAAGMTEAATSLLVDAAWHMGSVTLPEPRRARFLVRLADIGAVVVEATDPAEMLKGAR